MGLVKHADVHEICHHIADRGSAESISSHAGDGPRTDRFPTLNVGTHDGREHLALSVSEMGLTAHL